jgi:hypothetical protein
VLELLNSRIPNDTYGGVRDDRSTNEWSPTRFIIWSVLSARYDAARHKFICEPFYSRTGICLEREYVCLGLLFIL